MHPRITTWLVLRSLDASPHPASGNGQAGRAAKRWGIASVNQVQRARVGILLSSRGPSQATESQQLLAQHPSWCRPAGSLRPSHRFAPDQTLRRDRDCRRGGARDVRPPPVGSGNSSYDLRGLRETRRRQSGVCRNDVPAQRYYVQPSQLAIAAAATGMQDEGVYHVRAAFPIRDPFCQLQLSTYWPYTERLCADRRFHEIIGQMGSVRAPAEPHC